jgi:hypothetical protein
VGETVDFVARSVENDDQSRARRSRLLPGVTHDPTRLTRSGDLARRRCISLRACRL